MSENSTAIRVYCYKLLPGAKGKIEELVALDRSSSSDAWDADKFRKRLSNANTLCFGIDYDGRLIGYAIVRLGSLAVELTDLLVHKDFRRKGVGRCILECIQDRLLSENRRMLEIAVSEHDLNAQLFLKRCNIRAVEVIPAKSGDYYLFRAAYPFDVTTTGA